MTEKYPESFPAFRMYERTSAKGRRYMTGLWGGVRVAALATSETDRDGNPIWEVRLSQAPPRRPSAEAGAEAGGDAKRDWQSPARSARANASTVPDRQATQSGPLDDAIPF